MYISMFSKGLYSLIWYLLRNKQVLVCHANILRIHLNQEILYAIVNILYFRPLIIHSIVQILY